MTDEISQAQGIHEIDNAVENRVEETAIVSHDGNTQRGPLMQVLILNFSHRRIEAVAALIDEALDHLPLLFKGLVPVQSKLNPSNSDGHQIGS
jgi:hypothetical protein